MKLTPLFQLKKQITEFCIRMIPTTYILSEKNNTDMNVILKSNIMTSKNVRESCTQTLGVLICYWRLLYWPIH